MGPNSVRGCLTVALLGGPGRRGVRRLGQAGLVRMPRSGGTGSSTRRATSAPPSIVSAPTSRTCRGGTRTSSRRASAGRRLSSCFRRRERSTAATPDVCGGGLEVPTYRRLPIVEHGGALLRRLARATCCVFHPSTRRSPFSAAWARLRPPRSGAKSRIPRISRDRATEGSAVLLTGKRWSPPIFRLLTSCIPGTNLSRP